MDKLVYFAALAVNLIQAVFAIYLVFAGYGTEAFLAMFLLVPPALSLLAIHFSPDLEERRLTRQLRKARVRAELAALEKGK